MIVFSLSGPSMDIGYIDRTTLNVMLSFTNIKVLFFKSLFYAFYINYLSFVTHFFEGCLTDFVDTKRFERPKRGQD